MNIWIFNHHAQGPELPGDTRHYDLARQLIKKGHEALLCQTAVIGSGRGGMGELLQESGQIICDTPDRLSEHVETILFDTKKCQLQIFNGSKLYGSLFF